MCHVLKLATQKGTYANGCGVVVATNYAQMAWLRHCLLASGHGAQHQQCFDDVDFMAHKGAVRTIHKPLQSDRAKKVAWLRQYAGVLGVASENHQHRTDIAFGKSTSHRIYPKQR